MLMFLPDLAFKSFWAFVAALVTAAVLARPGLDLLIALNSRQTIYHLAPEAHQKKEGTPTMGGLIILIGLFAGLLFVDHNYKVSAWIFGFAAIGFVDDFVVPRMMKGKRGLGWRQKIVAQVALAVAAAPVFSVPFQALPVITIAFLVLFFSNAYNFADGLDGLAGSLGLILCFGLAALGSFGPTIGPILGALAGGFIPFLYLNAPPAKVFMGDVGALPIGALFGAVIAKLLILPIPAGPTYLNWQLAAPILLISLVMIAELVPVPLQVGYYKLTKKRLFPMTPIHHSFEKKGWPESRIVWVFVLTQLVFCILAVGIRLAEATEFPKLEDITITTTLPSMRITTTVGFTQQIID